MGPLVLPILLVLALASTSFSASASVVRYTYTGYSLTTAPGIGYDSTFTTVGTAPSGLASLVFSMVGDLGVNRPFDQFSPLSWSISDGVHSYSSAAPPPHLNFYTKFETDSTGTITNWYVQVATYNNEASADPYNDWDDILLRTSTDIASLPVPYDESRLFSALVGDYARSKDYHALSYNHPGTWTLESDTQVDGNVPEPTTLALVAIALIAVASCPMGERGQFLSR